MLKYAGKTPQNRLGCDCGVEPVSAPLPPALRQQHQTPVLGGGGSSKE